MYTGQLDLKWAVVQKRLESAAVEVIQKLCKAKHTL